jgi:type IV pilus assembly protein PilE
MNKISNNFGFSLIELLIAITIIGILSLIALPSYNQHLTTVYRTNAKTVLLDITGRMEQYYSQNNSYQKATLPDLGVNTNSVQNRYKIDLSTSTDTYLATATPINQQAQLDTACSTLSINETGQKTISGTNTVKDCW